LAGAGSGKTGVMAARVQHMLALGVPPSTILAVTFTRAAEQAMRERLKSTLGAHTTKAIRVSTFHALALSICRSYADHLDGLSADFLVCTTAQQMQVVAKAVAELRVRRAVAAAAAAEVLAEGGQPQPPTAAVPPDAGRVLRAMLQAKAQGGSPQTMRDENVSFVWARYEAWLRERGSLDMIDFIRVAARILSSVPAAREALRKAHTHVLVDEFQDTNALQLQLLTLLAPPGAARLTVVGDDDQSIYAFQGAQGPAAVRAFLAVYPDATRVALQQNYRSSGAIVRAASTLAGQNTTR
jgi:DNA helicase-2/ATP-dependent DNA helicase PcrA